MRILPNDRRRHICYCRSDGCWKIRFLSIWLLKIFRKAEAFVLLIHTAMLLKPFLGLVPEERFKDVVVFDPSDLEMPMGLNMLEYDTTKPEQKTFIINDLIDIFDKLYDLSQVGGPMFEYYLRNAVGLLMSDTTETPTLIDVPRASSLTQNFLRKN